MATAAYWTWVNAGRKWSLARPIQEMVDYARAKRIGVLGTIGNEEHLQSNFPEDHTPFSYTAYPVPLPGYWVTACDLAAQQGIGEAVLRDARAGKLPWLKYMNYNGRSYSFSDGFKSGSPNPDYHLHMSCFSDDLNTSTNGYDPLAGTGGGTTPGKDPDMSASIPPFDLPTGKNTLKSVSIWPVNAGDIPWGPAWFTIFADLFGYKAKFRIMQCDGNNKWTPLGTPENPGQEPVVIIESGKIFNAQLKSGTRGLSIQRLPVEPLDDCLKSVSASIEYMARA